MRKITLVSTIHEESGICTASKLHELLERARPEIIFLEIPPSHFDQFFKEKISSNLESNAVNHYLTMRSAKLVPADVYEVPDNFWVEFQRLCKRINAVSPEYRSLIDRNSQFIKRCGFAYLNSKSCIDLWLQIYESMRSAIEYIGQEELLKVFEKWKEVIEHRDREMMKNIQKYSERNEFNTGVFLVGAAHRGSIIEKSRNLSIGSAVTLDWNFENYENLI